MTTILRREGYCVNHKRIQRLCRDEGLRVLKKAKKRSRVGVSTISGTRLRATHPNHVWAIDFQFDQTTDLRTLKLLNITDEFTKEALTIDLRRSITADDTVAVLDRLAAQRGAPEFLRMDNGPELTANALRDWCRFSAAGTAYIEPGSPWENPFIESFNGKLRDELLTSRPSRACSKPRCWPRTSGSTTTPTGHTRRSVSSRRPSSGSGGLEKKPDSHSGWARNRGQVTPTRQGPGRTQGRAGRAVELRDHLGHHRTDRQAPSDAADPSSCPRPEVARSCEGAARRGRTRELRGVTTLLDPSVVNMTDEKMEVSPPTGEEG